MIPASVLRRVGGAQRREHLDTSTVVVSHDQMASLAAAIGDSRALTSMWLAAERGVDERFTRQQRTTATTAATAAGRRQARNHKPRKRHRLVAEHGGERAAGRVGQHLDGLGVTGSPILAKGATLARDDRPATCARVLLASSVVNVGIVGGVGGGEGDGVVV